MEGKPPSKELCGVKSEGKCSIPQESSAESGHPSEPALRTRALSYLGITSISHWSVLWEGGGDAQSSGMWFVEWAPPQISKRKEPGIKTSFDCQRESLKTIMESRSPTFLHTLSTHQAVPLEKIPLPQI